MSKLYTIQALEVVWYSAWETAWAAAHLGAEEQVAYDQTEVKAALFERVIRDLALPQTRTRVPQTKHGRFRT